MAEQKKKKELDILYERKAKADKLYAEDPTKLPLNQIRTYISITERIQVLENIKILVNSAPESMNPTKFKEHSEYVFEYLNTLCFTQKLQNFLKEGNANIQNFFPKNVSDYKKMISGFLISFLKVWKEEKNYK